MAQSSANRDEPTMEDILSSIRKIIQTNEEQSGADDHAPQAGMASNLGRQSESASPSASSTSLGDVAATQEGELVDTPERAHVARSEYGAEQDVSSDDASAAQPAANGERVAQKAPADQPQENKVSGDAVSGAQTVTSNIQMEQSAPSEEPAHITEHAQMAEQDQDHDVHQEPQSQQVAQDAPLNGAPLVSAASSAKIASSFADLSNALAEQSSTNIEEITQDIVRPLVKEWLDNNLPAMVERMVRDEIERIARGG